MGHPTKQPIGKRTRVQRITEIWGHETHFSAWLASDEGVELLESDLGLQVENLRCEVRAGQFPCDLVGNLVGDESHKVIIENQYGRTNHDHLGKLMTHAAMHRAMTAIWITEHVSGDHQQAVDWINSVTPQTVNIFLAELKAFRIGDSPIAPQLDVVCRPNVTVKPPQAGRSESEIRRDEWYLSTWETIHEKLSTLDLPFNLQKPAPQHWNVVTLGRTGFHVGMLLLSGHQKTIQLELYINAKWKASAFEQLEAQREMIEAELSASLTWKELKHRRSARIIWDLGVDPTADGGQDRAAQAFAQKLVPFYNAFRPRVHALVESEESPEIDE
jgi:hypothetical protein